MGLLIYAFFWLIFAALHSILARQSIQKYLENFLGSYYRLIYNLLAILKISAVLYAGQFWLSSSRFTLLDNPVATYTFLAIKLIGLLLMILAFSSYDVGRFVGITQIISRESVSSPSNEPLKRHFLHRWVRHPLYSGAFLVLWGGAVSAFGIWTAIWGTLYIVIGTLFEEHKLTIIYGDDYRNYKTEVPRFFPTLNFYRSGFS